MNAIIDRNKKQINNYTPFYNRFPTDFLLQQMSFPRIKLENLEILECLTTVSNYEWNYLVINNTCNTKEFIRLIPTSVEKNENYDLANSFDTNINSLSFKDSNFDFSELRREHMNFEENSAIFKLVNNFRDICTMTIKI